jgi:hypothetical protein
MLKFMKVIIVGLIPFVIYGLLIEFAFSFFNQNENSPRLSFLNFVGPSLLTIIFILLTGQRLVFKRDLIKRLAVHPLVSVLFVVLILLTVIWQLRYLLTLYDIRKQIEFIEFAPMFFGLFCSLFLATTILKEKHSF